MNQETDVCLHCDKLIYKPSPIYLTWFHDFSRSMWCDVERTRFAEPLGVA